MEQSEKTTTQSRRSALGGTDVAAVLGLPQSFRTALEVWAEKTGRVPREDISGAWRVKRGIALEPALLSWYAERTGSKVLGREPVTHPDLPILRCSPDGLAVMDGQIRLIEAKTAAWDRRADWSDGVPLVYQCQIQHSLGICLAAGVVTEPLCDVPVAIGDDEPEILTVEFDPEFFSAWRARAAEWWDEYVVGGVEPPAGAFDRQILGRLHPADTGATVQLSEPFSAIDTELLEVKASLKRLESRRDELENQLKAAIGDATTALLPGGGRYTWKSQTRAEHVVPESTFRVLRRGK